MKNEIGGFYEAVPQSELEGNRPEETLYDFMGQFKGFHASYYSCGRQAIGAVIDDIEKRSGCSKVCILPAYTCDTVIDPFTARGWKISFYDVDTDLNVCADELISLIDQVDPSVLLMHTYYGCDNIRDVRAQVKKWQDEKGLIFVEDMTQSLFLLDSIDLTADYYVGSLRKWFPIPDGGFALSGDVLDENHYGEFTEYVEAKTSAQKMKYDYLWDKREGKEDALEINRNTEEYLCVAELIYDISKISSDMLEKIDINTGRRARNKNAKILIDGLKDIPGIRSLISVDTESPLYLPIIADDRDDLQKHLIKNDVFAPVLWPVPDECADTMSDSTRRVYDNMLGIPCDQRYGKQDMERILSCFRSYKKG